MEQLTNELLSTINKDLSTNNTNINKDCFLVINNNTSHKKELKDINEANSSNSARKKSFDITLLSNPIHFQEFFENEQYLQSQSSLLYSLLSNYNIPSQYDTKFVEFLISKSDLKLFELYCTKNCDERTITLVLLKLLNILTLSRKDLDSYSSEKLAIYETQIKGDFPDLDKLSIKKLFLFRLVLANKM